MADSYPVRRPRKARLSWSIVLCFAVIAISGSVVTLHFCLLDGLVGLVAGLTLPEDTVYASGYSNSAFRRIREGMTKSEVLEILGEPLSVNTDAPSTSGCTEYWRYSKSPGDGDYRIRMIGFRDGVVRTKTAKFWVD